MPLERSIPRKQWRNAIDSALQMLDKRIAERANGYHYDYLIFGDVPELVDYKAPKCKNLKVGFSSYQAMPEDEQGRIVLLPRTMKGYFTALDEEGNALVNEQGLPKVEMQERPVSWIEYHHYSKPFSTPQFRIAQPDLAFLIKLKDEA